MGAISTLLWLDLAALTTCVVPTVQAWVETGEVRPSWCDALALGHRALPADVDRAILGSAWADGDRRRLPGGLVVPVEALHAETRGAVEIAVLLATRGDGLAIGNARSLIVDGEEALPAELAGLFDAFLARRAPPTALGRLLSDLSDGAAGFAIGDGGYGEGLRGWLDVAETAALSRLLAGHLPTSRVSDVAGLAAERASLAARGYSSELSTLVLVQAMATLAAERGLGLLHGRDLAVSGFASFDGAILRRARPVDERGSSRA